MRTQNLDPFEICSLPVGHSPVGELSVGVTGIRNLCGDDLVPRPVSFPLLRKTQWP